MADALFSTIFQLNDIQGGVYAHVKGYEAVSEVAKHDSSTSPRFGMEEGKESGHPLYSVYGLCDQQQNNITQNKVSSFESGHQSTPPLQWMQTDFQNRAMPQGIQQIYEGAKHEDVQREQLSEIGKSPKERSRSFSLASLELLNNYGKGMKNVRDENSSIIPEKESSTHGPKLSVGEIVRVAGERYVQFFTQKVDGFSMFIHPYSTSLLDLSIENTADVDLVQFLLVAAESVSYKQFDVASALITRCMWTAHGSGNPVQRVVYYFAEALQQRIEIETGSTTLERMRERTNYAKKLEVDFNLSFLACHQELPFSQAIQFAAVQSIIENVKTATKIHLVDLHIRSGIHWTVLMQALAERDDPPTIKISALGTTNILQIEETGKRLQSFAQSLNLELSFNIISVSDMKDLKEKMFKKESDEEVFVYSPIILRTLISSPDSLRCLMRILRRLRPSIVVVIEVEANHNSPSFVTRFIESLFFYSAFFDCFEDCMERENEHRKIIEGIYLGEGIRNMVGAEGDKRCTRNVNIDVWRECFARYSMTEIHLSESALRQANMVLNKFPKASSCTIINNGKGIVIRWKGTPIHSLTTWKFL